jgi:hypothetical protein
VTLPGGCRCAQAFARFGRGAVAVAFDQPVLVVCPAESADGGSQLVERVEALEPEDLLLERLDRSLGAAVGPGRAGDAEVVDLGLVVVGAEAGAAVVASASPEATAGSTESKRPAQTSRSRSAATKRSTRRAASYQTSLEAWSTSTKTAQRRPSPRVHASVASVAQSVSGASTVIVPSCRRCERLRTCDVAL